MDKLKRYSILLLIISVVIFGAYICYAKIISDTTPPELTCDSPEIVVSVTASDKELMEGVTAVDKRSGDVSDTLVVESISAFAEDEKRIITYAAIDEKGNVGRAQRELKYTDYEAPKFELTAALRYPVGSSVNLLKYVQAESTLDGDLTGNIKYSTGLTMNTTTEGTCEVEYRVTDSTGTVSYLPLEIEIYNPVDERINVELTDYLVYVKKGAGFDAGSYYKGADVSGDLSIDSNVDTSEEGVYSVDYTVTGSGSVGKSRLVVVVTN